MTLNVQNTLEKIYNNDIFEDKLYFTGGTALAYYLNHRVSEDIDIVSSKPLSYKKIIPTMTSLGASRLKDENISALKMAGLFPDEYIIKFVLDNVKLEFFQANRPIQQEILSSVSFTNYENSKLKILDLKTVAKLKLVALLMREKSRDLFDFGTILKHNVLTMEEMLTISSKINNKLSSFEALHAYLKAKKEPLNDEAVYLTQTNRIDLTFEEIKEGVLNDLAKFSI